MIFKRGTKIIALAMSLLLSVSVICGCFSSDKTTSENVDAPYYDPQEGIDESEPISKLTDNGRSEYKIVIPTDAQPVEKQAAAELQKYILTSSNATLPIVTDANSPKSGDKLISIGNTSLFEELHIDVSNLNGDGFVIKSEGNTIVINGQRGRGTLYGVYDFLEKIVGVRFLWQNTEVVPSMPTIQLYQMDIKEIPDFALRSFYSGEVMTDISFASKMRMVAPRQTVSTAAEAYGGVYGNDIAGDFHSYGYWLPYSQYSDKGWHSEILVGSGRQPVLSNGLNDDGTINKDVEESVVLEMIKNIKAYLLEHKDVTYVNLCQDDNQNYSRNENCLRQYELFGGFSGQMVVFTNAVAKEIDEWLVSIGDNRKMYYNMLAYQYTLAAPVDVSVDEKGNKTFTPRNQLAVPRDNVCIMIAPVEASYNEQLRTEREGSTNADVYDNIEKWQSIAKNFAIFDYNIQFNEPLIWFPVFEVLKPNLELYKEIGARILVAETVKGGYDTYQKHLVGYLLSKLMWNINRDVNALISEFNALAFGEEAGKVIDDFVGYQGAYYKVKALEGEEYKEAQVLGGPKWLATSDTLTFNHVTELDRYLERAKAAINDSKDYDSEQKQFYLNNLLCLQIQVDYMKYVNYDEVFKTTDAKKFEFMSNFYYNLKKCNVPKFDGYGNETIDSIFGAMGIY